MQVLIRLRFPLFFPVEQVFSTTDIMPHEEFRETIFSFKEWVRPQGWIDFVSAYSQSLK